jgi:hypothetical protein
MFFGIIIRMYYDEHNPPHLHAEYQSKRAVVDFRGNILKGDLGSKTALRLIREWIDLHEEDLLIIGKLHAQARKSSQLTL